MAFNVRSPKNLYAGLMFVGIGMGFALGALKYSMGTASRMGPAYFPTILGWLVAILGVVVVIEAFAVEGEKPSPVAWKSLILVLGSVCAFSALINTAGLIFATIAQIILSALGGYDFRWKEAVISAALMSVLVWAIFDVGLGLPFKLFPWSF